jgi:hypothetical protein
MTRVPPAAATSRPSVVDFFFLLGGCGLSLLLMRQPLLPELAPRFDAPLAQSVFPVLPDLVRLPEGIILLWPFFYATQRVLGRRQGLTAGEWVWIFAWLGTVLLNILAALNLRVILPEAARPYTPYLLFWPPVIWYAAVVPSMALLALLLALLGMFNRTPPPWTHNLSLVLVTWPVLPLAGILALGKLLAGP